MSDPKFRKVFDETPEFEACRAAEEWCEERGISVGIMERGQPRGLLREACLISKWHNLRPHERATLDGTMTGDMRNGPVTVELKGEEADYPVLPPEERAQ